MLASSSPSNLKAIADGPSILDYLNETVDEFGIREKIRFDHRISNASWSWIDRRWTLTVDHGADTFEITANFVFMCTGYYSYRGGFTPEFAGADTFGGQIIHPQQLPEDIDYTGKRDAEIVSGATADGLNV